MPGVFLSITTFLQLDFEFCIYIYGQSACESVGCPTHDSLCAKQFRRLLAARFLFYFSSRYRYTRVKIICPCQIRDTYFSIEKLPSKWVNEWMKRVNEQKKKCKMLRIVPDFFFCHRISSENEIEEEREGESPHTHTHTKHANEYNQKRHRPQKQQNKSLTLWSLVDMHFSFR